MLNSAIQLYEALPLFETGLAMGLLLLLLHALAWWQPGRAMALLRASHRSTAAGQLLLGLDMIWVALLLWNDPANPLRMPLFEFEGVRGILLLLCPVVWFVLSTMVKPNLFARALGLFILLAVIIPLSAAFLKEPLTRLLIPLWCYPALTAAMFWVAWPWLWRDAVEWLARHPRLFRALAAAGALYGAAMVACALLFWR